MNEVYLDFNYISHKKFKHLLQMLRSIIIELHNQVFRGGVWQTEARYGSGPKPMSLAHLQLSFMWINVSNT